MLTEILIAGSCAWSNPGANPYRTHPFESAVARALKNYDIPEPNRAELEWKIKHLFSDAAITIEKDKIHSLRGTATNLRDMHFGKNTLCPGPVNRSAWKSNHTEAALVYCSQEYCVAVPTVCGNISRIDFTPTVKSASIVSFQDHPPKFWEGDPKYHTHSVPEPNSLFLSLLGIAGIFGLVLPKKKQ